MDITKFDTSSPAVHQPNFKKGVPAIPNLDTLREELHKAFADDNVDVDYVKQLNPSLPSMYTKEFIITISNSMNLYKTASFSARIL